jgi:hypothetical protein
VHATGATGAVGVTGATGAVGVTGATGAVGVVGVGVPGHVNDSFPQESTYIVTTAPQDARYSL